MQDYVRITAVQNGHICAKISFTAIKEQIILI